MAWYLSKSDGSGGVLCGCAESTCCLYPWPDPDGTEGGPFYPPEDLPDAIDIVDNLGVFIEVATHNAGTYTYTGTTYNIRAGANQWEVQFPSPFGPWNGYGGCLIRDDVAKDQFSNAYTVTDETFTIPDFTITRQSQCLWTGISTDGAVRVEYNNVLGFPYKWVISFVGGPLPHDDPQTGPSGHYGTAGFGFIVL